MKTRVSVWAAVGFLVAACWATYLFVSPASTANPILQTAAELTQPIAFASFHFRFGISFYWAIVANAATYALVGLIVETIRQPLAHAD